MPRYFELRNQAARGTDSVAADMMRYMHTRQHLGKALIICEQPVALLSAARKQWLKLSRSIQKRRASTLNADKILKYTHAITRMQHMHFTAKTPLERPDAEVYFLRPDELAVAPLRCWSTYVLCMLGPVEAGQLLAQLPSEALVVDYHKATQWQQFGCEPKEILEAQVASEWRQMQQFLLSYDVPLEGLTQEPPDIEAMDDALDTLLDISHKFLQAAGEFQRALELARPLRLTKTERMAYDSLALLAHRVQALSPSAFTQRFLEAYNEDDTFFLYDRHGALAYMGETLANAVARHATANRRHLAAALRQIAEGTRLGTVTVPPPINNALSVIGITTDAYPLIL
jgi:hypothetical protein